MVLVRRKSENEQSLEESEVREAAGKRERFAPSFPSTAF